MRGRPKKNAIPLEAHEAVVSAYIKGISIVDLAEAFKVTTYVVKQVLQVNGIGIRPRGRMRTGYEYDFATTNPVHGGKLTETQLEVYDPLTSPIGDEVFTLLP